MLNLFAKASTSALLWQGSFRKPMSLLFRSMEAIISPLQIKSWPSGWDQWQLLCHCVVLSRQLIANHTDCSIVKLFARARQFINCFRLRLHIALVLFSPWCSSQVFVVIKLCLQNGDVRFWYDRIAFIYSYTLCNRVWMILKLRT